MQTRRILRFQSALALLLALVAPAAGQLDNPECVQLANLIYAGNKSSICFSNKFLETTMEKTNIVFDKKLLPVKLSAHDVYQYPFAIMTGEGDFQLQEQERRNLRKYLTRGGFLLASAGCSSAPWDQSFRREMQRVFPEFQLQLLPMEHPLYSTLHEIREVRVKNNSRTLLEGLIINGRIVCIYSKEGLNDTPNVKGCCCCGGSEIRNAQEVNANTIVYALTH